VCEAATAPEWHQEQGLLEHAPHWAVCVAAPAVISATDDHDAELIVLAVNNYARALREIQRLRRELAHFKAPDALPDETWQECLERALTQRDALDGQHRDLAGKMREALDEIGRLKTENRRLRRERDEGTRCTCGHLCPSPGTMDDGVERVHAPDCALMQESKPLLQSVDANLRVTQDRLSAEIDYLRRRNHELVDELEHHERVNMRLRTALADMKQLAVEALKSEGEGEA
jgi:HAMP domain-containing protein